MKKYLAFFVALILALTCLMVVACNNDTDITVTLHTNDGSNPVTKKYDESFVLPQPKRTGYTFEGWYTDEACSEGKEFVEGTELTKSIHLYAKWKKIEEQPEKVTVTFIYNYSGGPSPKTIEISKGSKVVFPSVSRDFYSLVGWFTKPSGGEQWTEDLEVNASLTLYARWTMSCVHDFGGSYFMAVQCAKGCGTWGREPSENIYSDSFVYDFNAEKKELIDEVYSELVGKLNQTSGVTAEEIIALFEEFDEAVTYVQSQYQFATVFYDVYHNEETRVDLKTISEYFNSLVEKYYKLFRLIDDSIFGTAFWEWTGWTEMDIRAALTQADSYDLENQNAIDYILDAYNLLMDAYNGSTAQVNELNGLYYQFVEANNNIAKTAGEENYMEYAYKNVYSRDYTPANVSDMRSYVKSEIVPIFGQVIDQVISMGSLFKVADLNFYNGLAGDNLLSSTVSGTTLKDTLSYVGNYFKFLNNGLEDENEINFYKEAEALFRNGNYFVGVDKGAYTWWIPSLQMPILYFGPGSYSSSFTFVHEFGHYYENIYNGSLSLSYDLNETHSQANEMLFLAWLSSNKPSDVVSGFTMLELEQLYGMMVNILLATAVDEFEQIAYSGATQYNGRDIPTVNVSITDADGVSTTVTVLNYQSLFETILGTYGSHLTKYFNIADYWAMVAFEHAAYYISYAMSALPCLELYAKAGTNGLEDARASYFKLFTFADQEQFVMREVHSDGSVSRYVKDGVTYQQILNYCGLSGPFEASLYSTITNYFASR